MRTKIIIIISCFILALVLFSCSGKQTGESTWQAEVKEENGVTTIINPSAPKYGDITLDLEENLSIGNEEENNYKFYKAYRIAVDDQSNIYVLDSGNFRIQKFDSTGKYLQTIGKKGQGPGEFERMYSLFLDLKNNIYISGRRRIKKFDNKGQFEKSITLRSFITDFWISSDNYIYGINSGTTDEGRKQSVVKVNFEGEEIETVAQFEDVKPVNKKSEGGSISSFGVSHNYNNRLYLAPAINNQLIYGYSADYSLFKLNEAGFPDLILKKDIPSQSISKQEKDDIIKGIRDSISVRGQKWPEGVIEEACQFPPHRPFFSGFATDDKGRIYVRKIMSVLAETETVEFDIFSSDGYYLYKTVLPFSPRLIKNGYVYNIDSNEETGNIRIKRFKIKNWDEIKTS